MVRHNNNCCEKNKSIRNKLYELWLEEGNVGTPSDFLEWLKGEKGDPGLSNLNHEDTDSIKMEGTGSSEDPVKSFVNISKDPANSISIKTDGLFVDKIEELEAGSGLRIEDGQVVLGTDFSESSGGFLTKSTGIYFPSDDFKEFGYGTGIIIDQGVLQIIGDGVVEDINSREDIPVLNSIIIGPSDEINLRSGSIYGDDFRIESGLSLRSHSFKSSDLYLEIEESNINTRSQISITSSKGIEIRDDISGIGLMYSTSFNNPPEGSRENNWIPSWGAVKDFVPLIAVEAQTVPGITGLIPKSFKLPYFDHVRDAFGVNKSIEYGLGAIDLSLHSADTDPTILLGGLSFSAVDGTAIGYSSVAMGVSSKSIGDASVTFGYETEAIGSRSFAIGQSTSAVGHYSFAGGFMSKAVGFASLAMGHSVTASGVNSIVFGNNSQTEGSNSIAGGYESFSKGDSSLAFGYRAKAEGLYSIALGVNTKALGVGTTALGEATTAVNRGSLVIGCYNSVGEEEVTEEWDPEGPAFEIGNGSDSSRSTSFTVHYNGNVKTKGNLEFLNPHDGFILKSPNGTRFKISIDNNGDFVTQQI